MRSTFSRVLESAGASEVVCLPDSDAAIAALADGGAFDFAVLDVKLSSATTSLSVAALLAEKNIPFIFLTGMRRDEVHRAEFPQAPLVEKPYLVSLLMEAAAQALAGRS